MPTNAVWYDLINACRTGLIAKALTAGGQLLPSAQIHARKLISDRDASGPDGRCRLPFLMAAMGGIETHELGDFEDVIVVYPVILAHVFASNQDMELNADLLNWRQGIIDMAVEFERTIQPNVTSGEISTVDIVPQAAVDMSLFRDANVDAGAILLKFRTARARTRT